jgi:hypothetical protein
VLTSDIARAAWACSAPRAPPTLSSLVLPRPLLAGRLGRQQVLAEAPGCGGSSSPPADGRGRRASAANEGLLPFPRPQPKRRHIADLHFDQPR